MPRPARWWARRFARSSSSAKVSAAVAAHERQPVGHEVDGPLEDVGDVEGHGRRLEHVLVSNGVGEAPDGRLEPWPPPCSSSASSASLHVLNARFPRRGRVLLVPSFFASWLTIELAPWWLVLAGRRWRSVFVAGGALDETGRLDRPRPRSSPRASASSPSSSRPARRRCRWPRPLDRRRARPRPLAGRRSRGRHVVFPFLHAAPGRRRPTSATSSSPRATPTRASTVQTPARRHQAGRRRAGRRAPRHPADPRRRLGHRRQAGAGHPAAQPPRRQRLGRHQRQLPAVARRSASPSTSSTASGRSPGGASTPTSTAATPTSSASPAGRPAATSPPSSASPPTTPRYQPGFEDVDTSVRAAVPFYGVYDFTNRLGHWHKDTVRRFIEPMVMQRKLADDPEAFAAYSPHGPRPCRRAAVPRHPRQPRHARAGRGRPRVRAPACATPSDAPVLYAEMAGAQHAFEIFPSYRAGAGDRGRRALPALGPPGLPPRPHRRRGRPARSRRARRRRVSSAEN